MTAISRIIAVGTLLTFVLGCSSGSSFDFNGHWIGHRKVKDQPGVSKGLLETASRIEITIQPDDTFAMQDAGIPKTGTIDRKPDGAVLHVTTIMDQPIERQPEGVQKANQPIQLKPDGGGKMTYFDPAGFDDGPIEMERKKN